ncbi:MAG: serine/threonine protein kinase [Planctomycetes bacterium]|nr:serine/threonine protein kinase [Planctomycetota bacterium]
MHLLLDLAVRRGHLDSDQARGLQDRVERGDPLPEILAGAGLPSRVVKGLVAELKAAAQGVTQPLPARGATTRAPSARGAKVSRGRSERDQRTEWLPTALDLVAPLPAAAEDQPGEWIGDFQLIELLGEGGMGSVYRAREKGLEREVALKLVSPSIATDKDAKERFLREARSAGLLNHPNVITILRVAEHKGRPYMVLEFLRGGDAEDLRVAAGGRLAETRALEIARDCARGLGAVEAEGLVHRDIKPANIFLTASGVAKLADLGLARTQSGDDRVTQTGMIIGTPTFMPPEQAHGDEVDIRSDIYSLGASLFLLLTGRAPFEGKSPLAVVAKVISEPTPDPRRLAPGLSKASAALVLKAMSKEPADRFQTSAELLAAIERVLAQISGGETVLAPQVEGAPANFQTKTKRRRRASAQASAGNHPAKLVVTVVALGAILVVGGLAGLMMTSRGAHPPVRRPLPRNPASGNTVPVPPRRAPTPSFDRLRAEFSERGIMLRAPRGTRGLLSLGFASYAGGKATLLKGAGPKQVTYDVQPGGGDFARAGVYGGQRLELPVQIRWTISEVRVTKDAGPLPVDQAQGLADFPTGFFLELGVRSSDRPCLEGSELEPGALWMTLQFSKKRHVRATFRRLNAKKLPGAGIDQGAPGVGRLLETLDRTMRRPKLTIALDLTTRGWTLRTPEGTQGGTWKAGEAPFLQGEAEGGFYLWARGGNWDTGRGSARVSIELLPAATVLPAPDRSRRGGRGKRRRR